MLIVVDLETQCRHITDAGDMPTYVTHVVFLGHAFSI